jgi:NADPH2:quinone reductase
VYPLDAVAQAAGLGRQALGKVLLEVNDGV